MTTTELVPQQQQESTVETPRLAVVPATESDVPAGSSTDVPAAEQGPTRDACTRARARLQEIWAFTTRDVWGRARRFVSGTLAPPDIVREKRPSLREVFNHARWGAHHPPDGPARAASVAVSLLLLPFVAAGYMWAWIFERASRVVFAGVVALVGSRIPGVDTALDVLVTVFTAPVSWLT